MVFLPGLNAGRGFLPLHVSCGFLPSSSQLNVELNRLASQLHVLLARRTLRDEIEHLNNVYADTPVTLDRTDPDQDADAARILLALVQGYIWEQPASPASRVPAVLAKNSYAIAKRRQRFPILTYYDYILTNWRLTDVALGMRPENIQPLVSFTGSQDEAWFIIIHVMIESVCAIALDAARELCALAGTRMTEWKTPSALNETELCSRFQVMTRALDKSVSLLNRMTEGCNTKYYWETLRHYLNGWDKIENASCGFKGVRFDGVIVRNQHVTYTYKGPSGAQSSIIPAMDAFLGITHDIDEMYQTLLNFQQYMPLEHVQVINTFRQYSIRAWVERHQSTVLTAAYHEVIQHVARFRLAHLHLVQKYIFNPAESSGKKQENIAGTGGTLINDYLGNRYHDTLDS